MRSREGLGFRTAARIPDGVQGRRRRGRAIRYHRLGVYIIYNDRLYLYKYIYVVQDIRINKERKKNHNKMLCRYRKKNPFEAAAGITNKYIGDAWPMIQLVFRF